MTRVKICGLTREEDARLAARAGAEYLGFVLAESPRRCDPAEVARWLPALKADFPALQVVGVFVRPGAAEVEERIAALGLDVVQLHGPDPACPVASSRPILRAIAAEAWDGREPAGSWGVLLDSARAAGGATGGTGRPWSWVELRAPRPARLFVAGGLDAANVGEAIRELGPFAVDASSRLEASPGRKDPARVRAFVEAVRATDRVLRPATETGERPR